LLAIGGGQYHATTNVLSIFTILAIMIGLTSYQLVQKNEKEVKFQENGTQKEKGNMMENHKNIIF
jgi:hypothetical protein